MKRITVSDIALRHPMNYLIFNVYFLDRGDAYKFKTYKVPPEIQDINIQSIAPSDDGLCIEVRIKPDDVANYVAFKKKYIHHLVMDGSIPV